jgi:hypothetical protein
VLACAQAATRLWASIGIGGGKVDASAYARSATRVPRGRDAPGARAAAERSRSLTSGAAQGGQLAGGGALVPSGARFAYTSKNWANASAS